MTDLESSQQLHAHARSVDKTLKIYKGLYHSLVEEPEKDDVFADLCTWLAARIDRHRYKIPDRMAI